MDRLVGGVGLRRGRRDADHLKVGDALDWWRVEECLDERAPRTDVAAGPDLVEGSACYVSARR